MKPKPPKPIAASRRGPDCFVDKATSHTLYATYSAMGTNWFPCCASSANYPARLAQDPLGHNSKAVHWAYAKRALMKLPSLEEYEDRVTLKIVSTV